MATIPFPNGQHLSYTPHAAVPQHHDANALLPHATPPEQVQEVMPAPLPTATTFAQPDVTRVPAPGMQPISKPDPAHPLALWEPVGGWPADCVLTAEQRASYGYHSSFLGVMMDSVQKIQAHHLMLSEQRLAQHEAAVLEAAESGSVRKQALAEWNTKLDAARQAWKDAIAKRTEAMRGWDEYVRQYHDAFTELRKNKPL